jgi:hypothetical protein
MHVPTAQTYENKANEVHTPEPKALTTRKNCWRNGFVEAPYASVEVNINVPNLCTQLSRGLVTLTAPIGQRVEAKQEDGRFGICAF